MNATDKIEQLITALNGFLWLGKNLANSDTQQFKEFYKAAVEDAKLAISKARLQ